MMDAYVVVLNWNGYQDTIKCLSTVLALDSCEFEVIVCDNGSTDASVEELKRWATKQYGVEHKDGERSRWLSKTQPELTLLTIAQNGGFAAGMNAGLRYAMTRGDAGFIWVLNNDTTVRSDSLAKLVGAARALRRPGILTPTVLMEEDKTKVWALGTASYCAWKGTASLRGHGTTYTPNQDIGPEPYLPDNDYPVGAAMLVSSGFLKEIGYLSERYFLYFEELDWISRASRKFDYAYVPDAVIYHRGAASVLRDGNPQNARARRLYWLTRSRILYTKAHRPIALLTVVGASLVHAMLLLIKREFLACRLVLLATLSLGNSPSHPVLLERTAHS